MIFKLTSKKDLGILKESLKEALNHTDYNSECFSCSDIQRAGAFCNDIAMIFSTLNDYSINITDLFTEEEKEMFMGYYEASDFEGMTIPSNFEILLYSDAVWRIRSNNNNLFSLKYSNDNYLKIEHELYTKYWSCLSYGCYYDMKPSTDSLVYLAGISDTLKKSLDVVLSELADSSIEEVNAVLFHRNELELNVSFVKEGLTYSLYVFENNERADIIVSLNKKALKIYPIDKENKGYTTMYNQDFCKYFDRVVKQNKEYEALASLAFDKNVEAMMNQLDSKKKFKEGSTELSYYYYCLRLKEVDLKNKALDKVSDNDIRYDIESDLYYLEADCSNHKEHLESQLYNEIAGEDFIEEYRKACIQNVFMLDEDSMLKHSGRIEYVKDNLADLFKSNIA